MSEWTVVRYDGLHPSHPEEDLPEDNTWIEICRGGDDYFMVGTGLFRREMVGEHLTGSVREASVRFTTPEDDIPMSSAPMGVVWRYVNKEEHKNA